MKCLCLYYNRFLLLCEVCAMQFGYYDLYVNQIELSMLRIREQNSTEKTGLYVTTWVFYGKRVKQYNGHVDILPDSYQDVILFAINAVDSSIIDLEKGY